MIRLESVSVSVNGSTQIYPDSVSITCGKGKGYNICSLSGDTTAVNVEVGDIINVNINGDIFDFIVDKKDYSENNNVKLDAYGLPYTLSDGSVSDTEYTYSTSDELIEDSCGDIPYENNLPTITFTGQTYAKSSTPMSRITDMVNVVGGDIYEVSGTLILDTAKTIPETPEIAYSFSDSENFSFAFSDKRQSSILVKEVLFNPTVDDIYSETSVTLDFDEDHNRGEVFFNPSLSMNLPYTIDGIDNRTPTVSNKIEKITLDDSSYVNTMGGIDGIFYIQIDGEPLDSSEYEIYPQYNVIRFLTPKSGELEVSYSTKTVVVYAYRTLSFSIKYGCSQCSDTIEIDADNTVDSGKCYAKIETPLTYENGGKVYLSSGADSTFIFVERKGATNLVQYGIYDLAGGGTLTVKYIYDVDDWSDTDFMGNITSSTVSKIETFSGTVVYDEDLDKYVLFLDKPITSINDIYFGSVLLDSNEYSYNGDGDIPYIEFVDNSHENQSLDVSMNVTLDEVIIPAPLAGHPVTLLDVITCDGVATEQFVPDDTTLCNLPATFKIDVASLFDVEISDIYGVELNGDFGTLVIDNFGMVEVTVDTAKLYTIDANNVKENGTITVDANGVV